MIRWIRPTLGTAAFETLPGGDYVAIDVRHLVDKGGNSLAEVRACVERGVVALRSGRRVVVACDFGISRSNATAAGILSIVEARSYDDALTEVAAVTGETQIKLDFARTVRRALGSDGPSSTGAILLTGGSGFVGESLVPALSAHHQVFAPTRAELDLSAGALQLDRFCSKHSIGRVVHLAYPRVYTNPAAVGESLTMLRTVLEVCEANRIGLVHVSASVVFGGYAAASLLADESLPLRPHGHYGDAKYLEQAMIKLYVARSKVEVTTCRLAPLYGPRGKRPRLLQNFRAKIVAGETVQTHRYKNAKPALDLLHVRDAAAALTRAVQCRGSETYHFGSGALHTTSELALRIGKLADRPVKLDEIPIAEDIGNILMDYRKAEAELDWRPETDLDDGLRETLFP